MVKSGISERGKGLETFRARGGASPYYTPPRENKGTEREAPGPGLGICQFR